MKDRIFMRVLICIIAVCILLTAVHLLYAVYAYQHCSIIQFIARELW